jgi:hypothetical protein
MKINGKNILAAAGIFFIAKFVVDKIVSGAFSNVRINFGAPTFDFSGLLQNPATINVRLPMNIINGNYIGVNVTNFQGGIYYGNILLSNVSIPTTGQIPANGQTTIYLNLQINAMQVINDVIASLNQTGTYSTLVNVIRLRGVLETSILRIPVDTTISIV